MSPSELNALHIIHVFSAVGMVALVFYACAGAAETRKKVMMWSGILSLLVVLTGIRMWQGLLGWDGGWPIVKLVCWLGLSALAGFGYRRREKASRWIGLGLALAAVALVMVYVRPF